MRAYELLTVDQIRAKLAAGQGVTLWSPVHNNPPLLRVEGYASPGDVKLVYPAPVPGGDGETYVVVSQDATMRVTLAE